MAAFEAAVLTAQLERLPGQIATRARNARLLRAELAEVAGLRFQDEPAQATANSEYLLLGRIDAAKFGMSRDEFHSGVTAAGIPCTPFYPHPLYGNPMYQGGGCRVELCPVSEACIRDAFWFPAPLAAGGRDDDTGGRGGDTLLGLRARVGRHQATGAVVGHQLAVVLAACSITLSQGWTVFVKRSSGTAFSVAVASSIDFRSAATVSALVA